MNALVDEKNESENIAGNSHKKTAQQYLIEIEGRKFSFSSTDEEKHIRKVELKLSEVFSSLLKGGVDPDFSQRSLKVALFLADELVRECSRNESQSVFNQIDKRLNPLITQLDQVLKTD